MDKYTGAHDQIMTSLERMQRFTAALQRRVVEQETEARQERFKRVASSRPARRWWQFWK